jgi:hypothetical protein
VLQELVVLLLQLLPLLVQLFIVLLRLADSLALLLHLLVAGEVAETLLDPSHHLLANADVGGVLHASLQAVLGHLVVLLGDLRLLLLDLGGVLLDLVDGLALLLHLLVAGDGAEPFLHLALDLVAGGNFDVRHVVVVWVV